MDHTLQAFQYENQSSPKLFKGKVYGCHLGEFSNTSFVVFWAERVNYYSKLKTLQLTAKLICVNILV